MIPSPREVLRMLFARALLDEVHAMNRALDMLHRTGVRVIGPDERDAFGEFLIAVEQFSRARSRMFDLLVKDMPLKPPVPPS